MVIFTLVYHITLSVTKNYQRITVKQKNSRSTVLEKRYQYLSNASYLYCHLQFSRMKLKLSQITNNYLQLRMVTENHRNSTNKNEWNGKLVANSASEWLKSSLGPFNFAWKIFACSSYNFLNSDQKILPLCPLMVLRCRFVVIDWLTRTIQ